MKVPLILLVYLTVSLTCLQGAEILKQSTAVEDIKNTLQSSIRNLEKEIQRITGIKKMLSKAYMALGEIASGKSSSKKKDQFVAVFDGGSTGTRLNIYRFDPKGFKLKGHMLKNVFKGIHLHKDPKKVISKLLQQGKEFLIENGHPPVYNFPMVFNGTAGLRLIPPAAQDKVLKEVKEALVTETNNPNIEVRVIDGKEEGFYAWAALVFVIQAKEKIGIIDLGGGSAQISFEIDKDTKGGEDGIVHGKNKNVLSRSFLGMGLNEGMSEIKRKDKNGVCEWGQPTYDIVQCKGHIKSTLGLMVLKRTEGHEIAPGLSQINTVFVSSFISEILQLLQAPKQAKFQDIKSLIDTACTNNSSMPILPFSKKSQSISPSNPTATTKQTPDCVSIIYAIMFMEILGVGLFTPIENAVSIPTDISWSLGRALSLIE
ncbi:ectonucleoside triphosphate diphosphohydrolase 5/6 [Nematocida sp. AWRm80]|nr:ectonucleoside triphosphate diphosphohydrolase 5/6 [Nematocida sp. AWRm80]